MVAFNKIIYGKIIVLYSIYEIILKIIKKKKKKTKKKTKIGGTVHDKLVENINKNIKSKGIAFRFKNFTTFFSIKITVPFKIVKR